MSHVRHVAHVSGDGGTAAQYIRCADVIVIGGGHAGKLKTVRFRCCQKRLSLVAGLSLPNLTGFN